ncbi:hypothetical protein [Nonomuraea sp. 10N515B]|uniref:hypothetical protein n=1 Tax=Nonomuraea sp. 10N515B TaxID=3457422 RepID=UPI003FCE4D8D
MARSLSPSGPAGAVEADDGMEVDQAAPLLLGDLGTPCPNAAPSSSLTAAGPTSPPYGNHPDVQAFGWGAAQRDRKPEILLFTGEKITANREVAIMLGVRPDHPVIHRRSLWHRGHTSAIHGASARLEINSYTNADMLPEGDDPKRHAQYRKRPGLFYQSLIRETRHRSLDDTHHGPHRLRRRTHRARHGLRRSRPHHPPHHGPPHRGHRGKAPANRYEIGYHRELADEPKTNLTPQELSDKA